MTSAGDRDAMRPPRLRLSVLFTLSLLWAAAGAAPAKAQMISWSRYGIGYVASPPNMMAGVDGYILFPSLKGLGIYVDAKFDVQSPAHDPKYLSDMTDADVLNTVTGAVFQDKKDSYRSFNVALVRPITPGLMLYAGGG